MSVIYNPFSLEGKSILVTGASSGIGQATAIECSRMGAKVIITGRDEKRLNETFQNLEGNDHEMVIAELLNQDDLDKLADAVPALDGVVFNAGKGNTLPLNFIKREDIDKVFNINTFAVMLLNKTLIRKKKINKGASLVFTSSIAAVTMAHGNGLYSAAKAALTSYMRTCARELADKKIRANAVLPGMVATRLIEGGAISEEEKQRDAESYPLKRYGTPNDIAWGIIYLLSDASGWVTGTSLYIDGGKTMR